MVEIKFKFPNWERRVKEQTPRIQLFIAAMMQENRAQLFAAEGAFSGHSKWKDLKSGENKKFDKEGNPNRQILSDTGTLRKSIGPETDGKNPKRNIGTILKMKDDLVTIGTTIAYAKIHNDGGIVKHPGTDNGFGMGIKIRPHNIPIPKRNFSDITAQDRAEWNTAVRNLLAGILNGE